MLSLLSFQFPFKKRKKKELGLVFVRIPNFVSLFSTSFSPIRVSLSNCTYVCHRCGVNILLIRAHFGKLLFTQSGLQSRRRRRRHLLIELNSTMKANARNAATVSQLLLLAFSTFSHEHNSRSPLSTLPLLRLLRCALLFQMTPPFLFFYADLFILQFLFFFTVIDRDVTAHLSTVY